MAVYRENLKDKAQNSVSLDDELKICTLIGNFACNISSLLRKELNNIQSAGVKIDNQRLISIVMTALTAFCAAEISALVSLGASEKQFLLNNFIESLSNQIDLNLKHFKDPHFHKNSLN